MFYWSAPQQTLSKQSRRRWSETSSHSLWRHCNVQWPDFKMTQMIVMIVMDDVVVFAASMTCPIMIWLKCPQNGTILITSNHFYIYIDSDLPTTINLVPICIPAVTVPREYHYNDVIMSAMASQITSLTIVYSTVYSGADQRKHQSSASLAFVRGIPHKKGQ